MTAPAHTPEQSTELAGLHPVHLSTGQDTDPTPEPSSDALSGPISLHPVPADTALAETPESADDPGANVPGDGSGDARELARDAWRDSAAAGSPLTGRELGERFDRSERWGRDRIAEARPEARTGAGTRVGGRRSRGGTARPGTHNGTRPGKRPDNGTATRRLGNATSGSTSDGTSGGVGHGPAAAGNEARHAAAPAATAVAAAAGAGGVPAGARLVAWAGFLFGTVISVAANVMHAWLPPKNAPADWAPGLGPQVGAAVWPIALVISVEVLSRVRWRPGWAWQLARYGGAGVVAVGAAVISYGHLHGVLAAWNYGPTGAAVGPLVIDGLMTISGFALLALSSGTGSGTDADR